MNGKRLYVAILVFMLFIAAFGVLAMVEGAVAYQNRPLLEDAAPGRMIQSHTVFDPFTGGSIG